MRDKTHDTSTASIFTSIHVNAKHIPLNHHWNTEKYALCNKKTFLKILEKIYNGSREWIEYEINEISESYEQEKKANETIGGKQFICSRN